MNRQGKTPVPRIEGIRGSETVLAWRRDSAEHNQFYVNQQLEIDPRRYPIFACHWPTDVRSQKPQDNNP